MARGKWPTPTSVTSAARPGKINLYVGRTAVKFNIPESEAVSELVDLIKEHGRWIEDTPAPASMAVA